jgi:hypothetical protein
MSIVYPPLLARLSKTNCWRSFQFSFRSDSTCCHIILSTIIIMTEFPVTGRKAWNQHFLRIIKFTAGRFVWSDGLDFHTFFIILEVMAWSCCYGRTRWYDLNVIVLPCISDCDINEDCDIGLKVIYITDSVNFESGYAQGYTSVSVNGRRQIMILKNTTSKTVKLSCHTISGFLMLTLLYLYLIPGLCSYWHSNLSESCLPW